jgi:SAM-dependent methyltransferase
MAPSREWGKFWAQSLQDWLARGGPQRGGHWGDEWGDPMTNLCRPLLEKHLLPLATKAAVGLEIGPGGGRVTGLLKGMKKLYLVELNPEFFTGLRERFGNPKHFVYVTTPDGHSMPKVPKGGVDLVFSWGTFVHFEAEHIAAYLKEIASVLRRKGRAVLNTPDRARPKHQGGFGKVSKDELLVAAAAAGLTVVEYDDTTLPNSALVVLQK